MAWILSLCAFLGAIVSGVVGMAGGTLLLALMLLVGLEPNVVVPLHAAVQLVSNVTRVWVFRQHVRWKPVITLALFAAPLPWVGLQLLKVMTPDAVRAAMGIMILYAVWAPKWGLRDLSQRQAFGLAGLLGGAFGVVVGAVGPLIAPFFLRPEFDKQSLIGTKAVCQAYLHVLKIVAFAAVGFSIGETAAYWPPMALAVIVGTYVGKWLLGFIAESHFRWLYKGLLSVLALRLVGAVI